MTESESKELKQRIEKTITDAGFKLGAYGYFSHSQGLPSVSVRVMVHPDYSPVDGAATVLVTPTTLQVWTCRYPTGHNDWYSHGTKIYYDTPDQLIEYLKEVTTQPRGGW